MVPLPRNETIPPIERCDVLVVGSGAAGLAAAARLRAEGVEDVLVLTESLRGGTSINTGSDKQTYYKLGLCGDGADSPTAMARTYIEGGAMHGDLALVEAALSARCFSHLCDIGVPFPHDAFGQYAGYRTDHDPARRATSVGPHTSREMCLRLLDECRLRGVRFAEGFVAVALLAEPNAGDPARPTRCTGALAVATSGDSGPLPFQAFLARDTVFAVGGPGGLYARSVYPACHTGGIGLALAIGARARNLPLSQFGLASVKFRWNVSGTYMQSLPRLVSTAADGVSDRRDFLLPAFGGDPAAVAGAVFLKGYQWPFDAEKASTGSSRIDLLVRAETLGRGRRVFLDYRSETPGLDPSGLPAEARDYLERSGAISGPPIARLLRMNPGAVALYREHGIDLAAEPLEIALCAQHNNGGLAADAWWQSENVAHLWPIGEVNGSHGVRRPGGSALNAGQVGAYRCAEAIARGGNQSHAERKPHAEFAEEKSHAEFAEEKSHAEDAESAESLGMPPSERGVARSAGGSTPCGAIAREAERLAALLRGTRDARAERVALQARMDAAAGPVRNADELARAAAAARAQLAAIETEGFSVSDSGPSAVHEAAEALRTWQLCLAHVAYLEACLAEAEAGAGSRGSALVLEGDAASGRVLPENPAFRSLVQETELAVPAEGAPGPLFRNRFAPVRPIPHPDDWFENVWRDYRESRSLRNL